MGAKVMMTAGKGEAPTSAVSKRLAIQITI